MSSDFETITLADVIESANTGLDAIKRAPIVERDTGFKCLRIQDVSQGKKFSEWGFTEISENNFLKFQLKQSEILIARTGGSVGVNRFINEKVNAVFNNGLIRLRINKKKHDAKYVYYLLQTDSYRQHIHAIAHSTAAQPNMKIADFLNFKFVALNKNHEIEIAKILSSLDDRITLLRETNTTLEAIAQALFKSWFVDFDPVHAKQQGREPEGMDTNTAALFPDSFEESELGLVPMGWRVGTLADLAILNSESWTAKTHPETVQYIDLANAKNNEIDVVTEYDFDEAPSRARRVLRSGDSIIGTVRPGNRSFAYIHQAPSNLTGSTGFAVLRPKEPRNTEFVFVAATQDASIDHLAHVADGGAYPAVRPEVVASIQTILPTTEVMEAFHNIAAPIFAKIGENHLQALTLANLRDTLLPRLISGQLRLPDSAPA
jgi:type I restriction enzyme S subunit